MSKKLNPEDEAVWHEATQDISGKRTPAAAKKPDDINFVEAVRAASLPPPQTPAKPKVPPAPLTPLDKRSAARMFKPHGDIEASLDLHGLTQEQAHACLTRFMEQQIARGARRIEIITGKGRSSEGILRRVVPLWLNEKPWRAYISAIAPAPENKGGEGALHVLLKNSHKK